MKNETRRRKKRNKIFQNRNKQATITKGTKPVVEKPRVCAPVCVRARVRVAECEHARWSKRRRKREGNTQKEKKIGKDGN